MALCQSTGRRTPSSSRSSGTVARSSAPAAVKPDLYSDLIKLDELRKRGILTEAEFQMLKARLLNAQ